MNDSVLKIEPEIQQQILAELRNIEQSEQVKILYACESGSRAWGFASQDSDYDVRFIYIHSTDYYLSIDEHRDVIEKPINNALDISGWDIRKALCLFRKSNPPLLEWLQSPLVYLEQSPVTQQIRDLRPTFFSPKANMYHYLRMAEGNFKHHLQGEQIKIKKYFYVLRPLLACLWIQQYQTIPPIEFDDLVAAMLTSGPLLDTLTDLLVRKKAGDEYDPTPRLLVITDYVQAELAQLNLWLQNMPTPSPPDTLLLDQLFRRALDTNF
jgi:predicted nucleotidyltransferase